jgi:hypothetical protein
MMKIQHIPLQKIIISAIHDGDDLELKNLIVRNISSKAGSYLILSNKPLN